MRVAICGGGVIGACTAYFLSRRGVDVTVVERAEVAAAASGKAGGFLALDWCAGSPLDELARRSFELHAALADEFSGDWSYRRMAAYSGFVAAVGATRRRRDTKFAWLSDDVTIAGEVGTERTTAIVNPRGFTVGMMRAAQMNGAKVHQGQATGLSRRIDGAIESVEVEGERLAADAVVIAMGPWSMVAAQWLRLPRVMGLRSPSIVYDTGNEVPAQALFLEYQEGRGASLTIEVFPRADGSTHVVAFSAQTPLPMDPTEVVSTSEEMERLQAICERLSPMFRPDRIIARQACFRPVTQDGLPLIGKVPGTEGAFIATGHSVWGILNAPATGEAMAELIVNGSAGIDLTAFDPARLRPLKLQA